VARKKLVIVLALVLAAALLAGVTFARRGSAPPPAVDRQLRAAVVRYEAAKNPVRPPKLYGKTLTLPRCITLMNEFSRGMQAVASGDAARYADAYQPLRQVQWDEARVHRYRGPDALPVAWTGRVAYWQSPKGRGDRYSVRAAVYLTMVTAIWDGRRLTKPHRAERTSAPIADYTLERFGDAWKVTKVVFWRPDGYDRFFTDGSVQRMVP
jgi:hypothetical protein